jgi:Ca-activated chloride channel family protein
LLVACALLFPRVRGGAQSGVLIPSTTDKPDANILSLQVMNVDVLIDNQHARVRVLQIFDSHVAQVLEGKYLFALSPRANVSDFAVWDGDTRIPGVMLERRRANAVYSSIKEQQTDPGLLQQDDEHEGRSAFNAKVFPIPAYGTKRVELEYTETLPVESLRARFSFPLKASFGEAQRVGELNIHVRILSDAPIGTPQFTSPSYALRIVKQEPHEFEADFEGRNVELREDFALDYGINVGESTLSFITHRAPERISAYDLRDPSLATPQPDGYFQATAIFNRRHLATGDNASAPERFDATQTRRVLLMLDTSLSMRGEKLARAVEASEYFLHGLAPHDEFNLALFNEETRAFSPVPLAATPEHVERALAFVRDSTLGGATDLRQTLRDARTLLEKFSDGERSLIIISDANPTTGTSDLKKILREFDAHAPRDVRTSDRQPRNAQSRADDDHTARRKHVDDDTARQKRGDNDDAAPSARVFAFALGSDANSTLMRELADATHGHFAQARETEDISLQLKLFFEHVGVESIEDVRFDGGDASGFYQVYPTDRYSFDGSSFAFVGRYRTPRPVAQISLQARHGTDAFTLARAASLPEFEDAHAHLPRVWARARVDALLREMDIEGEREDHIAEIIRLSQKYKLLTPYTAFLAAPRALLRPRLIQPGDPVIRVKTDASIASVFAVLPFGETLPLKFLAREGVWEGRFLAPAWMPDGAYKCRLLLTDKDGAGFQEEKSFVVDSHAPRLAASVETATVRAGDELGIRVAADPDTSRLTAKMYGARPVELRWSAQARTNVGRLRVPPNLAAGRYVLNISAEDFAHNHSSAEIEINVLSR